MAAYRHRASVCSPARGDNNRNKINEPGVGAIGGAEPFSSLNGPLLVPLSDERNPVLAGGRGRRLCKVRGRLYKEGVGVREEEEKGVWSLPGGGSVGDSVR